MKKFMAVILMTVTCIQKSNAQDTISKKLDEVISRYVQYDKFNGTALVAHKGEILLEKGYGLSDVTNKTPNDSNTIFLVGSITKEFTAAIVLTLTAENKLSLSDKLTKYFPDFPNGDNIIIKNLLDQTSGIFNYTEIGNFWSLSGKPTDERNVLDSIKTKTLLFIPGEKFSYSNSNYMLLAYIIQKVTKKPYEVVVRSEIFEPLKMSHSGFDFKGLKSHNKATGYWNFSPLKYTVGPSYDSTEFIGAGEIYSTSGDLYQWHRALQEGRVLNNTLQNQAYSQGKGPYGFGWELDSMYEKKIVGHRGRMLAGFESKMMRVPGDDIFIILLDNNADGPCLDAIGQRLLAILYGLPYTLPEPVLSLSEKQLQAYTGKFGTNERYIEIHLINGHLFSNESSGDNDMRELFPLPGNRLTFMDPQRQVISEFTMNEHGIAEAMIIKNPQSGKKITLQKIK